jgi:hypothetical protein
MVTQDLVPADLFEFMIFILFDCFFLNRVAVTCWIPPSRPNLSGKVRKSFSRVDAFGFALPNYRD